MAYEDARYALRLMRRSPGFTAVAVFSLALGIGANAAIFSLLNTVMLRTLEVQHPEQLVEFLQKYPGEPRGNGGWSRASYEHFRDHAEVYSAITGTSFDDQTRFVIGGGTPETVISEGVLGNYFRTLGLKPAAGRFLGAGDTAGAVVNWRYWRGRLHGDPLIVGRSIRINDQPMTIVGVAPRGYDGPRVGVETDIWTLREKDGLTLLARLKPGATMAQARAEIAVLYGFTMREHPRYGVDPKVRQMKVELEPAGAGLANVRDQIGKPLVLLMAVVGSVLLLACVNLASMLLARGAGRQGELAVRVAVGAGRLRLMRQMLTETVLLSVAGTVLGLVLAYFSTAVLLRIMASARVLERIDIHVQPDWHLLAFAGGVAVVTGVLFGLAPAWYAMRASPAVILRQSGSRGETRVWRWFGKSLVATQVAISVLLVTAAALFLGHLTRLRTANLGFRSDHVLLMILDPSVTGYTRNELAPSYRDLLGRLEAIPGVRSATMCACSPIQGCGASRFVTAEGFQERPEDRQWTALSWVAPKYFETIGTPLIAGRDFSFRDAGGPRVAILSQEMARHYFPEVNAIGRHVTIEVDPRTGGWQGSPTYEVIGVAGDSKVTEVRDPPHRAMYFNMFQGGRMFNQFVLRTSGKPEWVAGAAQRAAREAIRGVAVAKMTTLEAQVDSAIVPERLIATISEFFGVLGAVMAGIGLYGLLAYSVTRRVNEIGVRMALGATAGDVRWLVLRETAGTVAAGIALGAALVIWCRPVAASLVPDLRFESAAPVVWSGAVMAALAVAASYLPARRAGRVDPMKALRQE